MFFCSQEKYTGQSHSPFVQSLSSSPLAQLLSSSQKPKQKRMKKWTKEIECGSIDRQSLPMMSQSTVPQLSPDSISSESTFFTSPSSLSKEHNKISEFQINQQNESFPIQRENKRVMIFNKDKPLYIQNFSQLNSELSDFIDTQFSMQPQRAKLTDLLRVARYAINEVINIAKDAEKRMRIQCGVQGLGLKFICNSTCKVCKLDWQFNRIKPVKQCHNSDMNIFELIEKLQLLDSKITRYQIILSLTEKLEVQIYRRVRQSLSQIEQDLLQCSSLLYLKVKSEKHYPSFCYAYVELIWQKASAQQQTLDSQLNSI